MEDEPPPLPPLPPPPIEDALPLPEKKKEEPNLEGEMYDDRRYPERYEDRRYDDQGRYQTTTTVVETTEYVADDGPAVRLSVPKADCSYCRTLGGMMKIVCLILCLLCFICLAIGGPGYYSGAGWATFVTTVGMSITGTLLLLYIFRVVDQITQVPWIVGEMCFCFAWTIFFFIAGSVLAVAASQYSRTAGWAFASFFAFGAMCAYGFDCYLKFLSWRNNEVATGGGVDYLAQHRNRAEPV